MNRKITKIVTTSIAAIALSSMAVFATNSLNEQVVDYSNNNQTVLNYSGSERITDYTNNALIISNSGTTTTHEGSYGQRPIMLSDGNILYYSSWGGSNSWDLIDQQGNSLDSGTLSFKPLQAIQLDDGNIFVVDDSDGWYVYSGPGGDLLQQGTTLPRGNMAAAKFSNGDVAVFGFYGEWLTIGDDGTGNYVVKSSDKIVGSTFTSKNINLVSPSINNKMIIEDSGHRLMEIEINTTTGEITSVGNPFYLRDDNGGKWIGDTPTKSILSLSNGNVAACNGDGEYVVVNLNTTEAVWGAFGEGLNTESSKTVFEKDGIVFFVDKSGEYYAISNEGEYLFSGNLGMSGNVAGAVNLDDGSVYIGGSSDWGIFNVGYSFENEIIDINETKAQILQYTDADGKHISTGVSTEAEVIDALRDSVVTAYNAPLEAAYSDVVVYDREVDGTTGEESFVEINDLDTVWTSDEINFQFVSAGTDESVVGETDIYTVDLEFNVAITDMEISDVSQNRAQINYELIVPDTNPVVAINLVDANDDIVLTNEPAYDATNGSLIRGSFILEGLDNNELYDGYYLQVEYKQNILADSILTSRELDGSEVAPFKTLNDKMEIKDNRVIAQPNISGDWVTNADGHTSMVIEFGVYDDGSQKYNKDETVASIKYADKNDVVSEAELGVIVYDDIDDPNTIVKEHSAVLTTQYRENVEYSNLEISLTGSMEDAISIPVYDTDGNVLIVSRAPENQKNPNHLAITITISILITMMVIIIIVGAVVIWKKHHFHH